MVYPFTQPLHPQLAQPYVGYSDRPLSPSPAPRQPSGPPPPAPVVQQQQRSSPIGEQSEEEDILDAFWQWKKQGTRRDDRKLQICRIQAGHRERPERCDEFAQAYKDDVGPWFDHISQCFFPIDIQLIEKYGYTLRQNQVSNETLAKGGRVDERLDPS